MLINCRKVGGVILSLTALLFVAKDLLENVYTVGLSKRLGQIRGGVCFVFGDDIRCPTFTYNLCSGAQCEGLACPTGSPQYANFPSYFHQVFFTNIGVADYYGPEPEEGLPCLVFYSCSCKSRGSQVQYCDINTFPSYSEQKGYNTYPDPLSDPCYD